MNFFTGTADYYRRFRSDVPDSVAAVLTETMTGRETPLRLLDVGTGTGFVIRALLDTPSTPHFDDLIGVDPEPEMLTVTEDDLRPRVPGRNVSGPHRRFSRDLPAPGRMAARSRHGLSGVPLVRRPGVPRAPRRVRRLRRGGRSLQRCECVVGESVIGYLHSTSFAAPHHFGERLHACDAEVRRRLHELSDDDTFVDENAFEISLARRPT